MGENGIQPMYDLADRNGNNDMGGSWIWIILILLFAGDGLGGNKNNTMESEFIQRDIFNTNQNVSTTGCQTQRDVLESRYTNQLGLQTLGQQMSECCCETNRNIDSVRAEAYKNTCEITNAIHAEGEATRGLITQNTIQELRDNLQSAQLTLSNANQTQNIIGALQPTPKPAYLTCSPYFAYGQGCGGCGGCGNI